MMGAHVLELCRLHGVAKLVVAGTVCAYPKHTPTPFSRGRPLERLPGGDERALRRREEVAARRRAGLPRAVRARRDLPAAGEPLRAARQLRPRDLARRPGADPQDARRRRTRSCSGATARRRASSSTSRTPPTAFVLAAERDDGRRADQRRHRARRSRSASSPTTIAELTGLRGRDRLGRRRCRTASRAGGSTRRRAARAPRLRGGDAAARGARAHDRLVPRPRRRLRRADVGGGLAGSRAGGSTGFMTSRVRLSCARSTTSSSSG